MAEELFDIVDADNAPLGVVKSRALVHKEMADWHRTTHIWIFNSKKQILCQQRSLTKDKNPGLWMSFFGGHLKAGESYEQNALTELREELGLEVAQAHLVPLYVRRTEKEKHFGQVYVLFWDGSPGDVHFDDGEVQRVAWLSLEALEEKITAGLFCNRLDDQVLKYVHEFQVN